MAYPTVDAKSWTMDKFTFYTRKKTIWSKSNRIPSYLANIKISSNDWSCNCKPYLCFMLQCEMSATHFPHSLSPQAASSEPANYIWCPSDQNQIPKLMKQYLIQLALCDEWCRVFIKERRLGLGLFVACAYSIAMGTLMVTCVGMSNTAALLLLPSLLALIVSTWLNLVIYCNRYIRKRTKPIFTPINSLWWRNDVVLIAIALNVFHNIFM